jgi:hypothetical protein
MSEDTGTSKRTYPVSQDSGVPFWKKESNNYMSHSKGLTPEQVEALKALKVGDRLILWDNNPKEDTSRPPLTLKIYRPKAQQDF